MQTVEQMAAAIAAREGDRYTNDPADRGGPTRNGITLQYLRGKGVVGAGDLNHDGRIDEQDVMLVSAPVAESFYIMDFFLEPDFNQLPPELHPIMFDMAVNHGPNNAGKLLQEALTKVSGAALVHDGVVGPATVAAAQRALVFPGFKPTEDAVVEAREAFYNAIIARDPSQAKFRNGWLHRAEEFRV